MDLLEHIESSNQRGSFRPPDSLWSSRTPILAQHSRITPYRQMCAPINSTEARLSGFHSPIKRRLRFQARTCRRRSPRRAGWALVEAYLRTESVHRIRTSLPSVNKYRHQIKQCMGANQ